MREYATFKMRFKAALFDYIVISGYLLVLVALGGVLRGSLTPLFGVSAARAEAVGFLFLTLPVGCYFLISEVRRAATWGKKKMGIAVVTDVTHARVTPLRALIRNAVKFLPWELAHFVIWRFYFPTDRLAPYLNWLLGLVYVLILLYAIVPFMNRRRKSVYDWAAGTAVVIAD